MFAHGVRVQVLQCVRCSDETAARLQAHVHGVTKRGRTDVSPPNAVLLTSIIPLSLMSVIKLVVRSMFMPTCAALAVGDRLNSRDDLGGPDSAHHAAMTALRTRTPRLHARM